MSQIQKQTLAANTPPFPTWASQKGQPPVGAMGSLFSRVAGGSAATESGTVLASEVEALPCSAVTPGASRAEQPWPLERRLWPDHLHRSPPVPAPFAPVPLLCVQDALSPSLPPSQTPPP